MEFIKKEKTILEDLATFYSDDVVEAIKDEIDNESEKLFDYVVECAFGVLDENYGLHIANLVKDILFTEGYDIEQVENLIVALPEEEITNTIWGQFLQQCSEIYENHYKTDGKRLIFLGDYECIGLKLDGEPLGFVDYSQLIPGHENVPIVVRVYLDMVEKQDKLHCTYVSKDSREMSDFLLNKQDEVLPLLLELCGVKEDEVSYQ